VHESMNLAALWKLPIIYIIENNEYSMGTTIARSSAGDPLTKRAGAFDMAAIQANAWMSTTSARRLSRRLARPHRKPADPDEFARTATLPLDVRPRHYRSKEEIEKRKQSDPIELYKSRLSNKRWPRGEPQRSR